MKEISNSEKIDISLELIKKFSGEANDYAIDGKHETIICALPFINVLHNDIESLTRLIDSNKLPEENDRIANLILQIKDMLKNIDDFFEEVFGFNIKKMHPDY